MNLIDQLHDIYDISYQPFWQHVWFKILSIIFLLGVVGGAVFLFMRKKRKEQKKPYWQEAGEKLKALEVYCTTSAEYEEFYKNLTSIMKDYLGEYYKKDLTSKTDQEVVYYLAHVGALPYVRDGMDTLYKNAVGVKFAQKEAACTVMQHDLKKSKMIVLTTHSLEN